jgi:hypothetical protein
MIQLTTPKILGFVVGFGQWLRCALSIGDGRTIIII